MARNLLCAMVVALFSLMAHATETDRHNYLVDAGIEKSRPDSYLFKTMQEAFEAAQKAQQATPADYNEAKPLHIRIVPSVYWLDNPDDNETRKPLPGEAIPYGIRLKLSHLRLIGLGASPEEVVLASNRGQTHGAEGNFTMMHIEGDDIQVENITFGNYCNVDLVYGPNPLLNRQRRADAIVQAQLIICKGDRYVARNCRFISRLNLCPFAGAERALFDNCYFECTDDALCGTAVYLNCRFTFFSGKPFYATHNTGAVFLNCDIHALTQGRQYLVKVGSPVTMVDCRWTSEDEQLYIGWTQDPIGNQRSYQHNLTLNGKPLFIGKNHPTTSVEMADKGVLKAYKLDEHTYNLYNLLRGTDNWNPTNQQTDGQTCIPTLLQCSHAWGALETGKDSLLLQAYSAAFSTYPDTTIPAMCQWRVAPEDKPYVVLKPQADGGCLILPNNQTEEVRTIHVVAQTDEGLEAACVLNIKPSLLPTPLFTQKPRIKQQKDMLSVQYELALQGRDDHSVVTWYRCKEKQGEGAIAVGVSRNNQPMTTYTLAPEDNGYYIMATVAPKHARSLVGAPERCITGKRIRVKGGGSTSIETDFQHFPAEQQTEIIPGFWTLDAYKPIDTEAYNWQADNTRPAWFVGEGVDGAKGVVGLQQAVKGARLLYTPLPHSYGDMQLSVDLAPCKTAGQGFGSATGQYLDIYIKYDTKQQTGYGLRIIRTTRYDRAVEFMLMRYENGKATPISPAQPTTCYRTGCQVVVRIQGNRLTAHSENRFPLPPSHAPVVKEVVDLEATIEGNEHGGCGFQHTGSVGASATLLTNLTISYE